MKLSELKPGWETHGGIKYLVCDCPVCRKHRIHVPTPPAPNAWTLGGSTFEDITLSPSVLHKTSYADGLGQPPRECESHFFVKRGAIEMC